MCLCAFLYFNKLSTVNINYFCNQKKKHNVIGRKKKSLLFNFSNLSVAERYLPRRPQIGEGRSSLFLSLSLFNAGATSANCRSPINTNQFWRPQDQSPWQPDKGMTLYEFCHESEMVKVGKTPDLMARGGQRAIVFICGKGIQASLRLKGTDISPNNGTLEVCELIILIVGSLNCHFYLYSCKQMSDSVFSRTTLRN